MTFSITNNFDFNTLNRIKDIFFSLAIGNQMVNDFGFGPTYNINAAVERKYPLIWVEPSNSALTRSGNVGQSRFQVFLYTYNIYCVDRIIKGDENYDDVLSDCQFILQSMLTELDQHPYYTYLKLNTEGDVQLRPVYEVEDANTNGWVATLTLRIFNTLTPCSIPQIPILNYPGGSTSSASYRLQGPQGVQGPQGFQGAQGNNGIQGPQGNIGPQGFQGIQGFDGLIGATGPQGNNGVAGTTGSIGPQGLNGVAGSTGPQGPAGMGSSFSGITVSLPLVGNGVTSQLSLGYSSDFDLNVSNNLELALSATTLPSLSINRLWTVNKTDGTTFSTVVISGTTIQHFMTNQNITVPTGCKVNYGATATIGALGTNIQAPTSVTGNFVFIPNPPITYPISSYFTSSVLSSGSSFNITEVKPKAGLQANLSTGAVTRASGNDSSSVTDQLSYNDVFYFGYTNTLGSGTITQTQANTLTSSTVAALNNFRYGTQVQTLTPVTDSAGFRVILAYPATYNPLITIVINNATNIIGNFFIVPNMNIQTISGITVSYRAYVAAVDNSFPGVNSLTLT